jgi:hypothetical protein
MEAAVGHFAASLDGDRGSRGRFAVRLDGGRAVVRRFAAGLLSGRFGPRHFATSFDGTRPARWQSARNLHDLTYDDFPPRTAFRSKIGGFQRRAALCGAAPGDLPARVRMAAQGQGGPVVR